MPDRCRYAMPTTGLEPGLFAHWKLGYDDALSPYMKYHCASGGTDAAKAENNKALLPISIADGGRECTTGPPIVEHSSKCGIDRCDGK